MLPAFWNFQVNGLGSAAKVQIYTLFIPAGNVCQDRAGLLCQPVRLCLCNTFRKCDVNVIDLDFIILHLRNVHDGIPDAKAGDQKSGAAADPQYHHEKTLFIADDIPHGNLMKELHSAPDKGYFFQENPLAAFWRFWTDQVGRNAAQLMPA